MTRDTAIRAINCTSCGAGLNVLGGGRVLAHICTYCGAELDASDNYKVLAKFEGLERPDSPIKIGMTGQIDGAEYTVIGTLGLVERWNGRTWHWVEHQIFSPTHGYAWLTWEDGHLIFTRRYRRGVEPGWITPARVESSENRPYVRSAGVTFRYYETTTAEIDFAEGEFTWHPWIGDTTKTVSMMADGVMLDFTASKFEQEIEISTYPDQAATFAAFGGEPDRRPAVVHPLQPPWRMKDDAFMLVAGLILAVPCLIAAIILGVNKGQQVLPYQSFSVVDLPQEVQFDLSDTRKLALIQLRANVDNSWAWVEASVTGPDDETLFEVGREIGRYSGRDSEGTWSEGSRLASLRFHPPTAGSYTIELNVSEAQTWNRGGPPVTNIGVEVHEGATSGFWLAIVSLVLWIPGGLAYYGYLRSRARRWKNSDWTEDDD